VKRLALSLVVGVTLFTGCATQSPHYPLSQIQTSPKVYTSPTAQPHSTPEAIRAFQCILNTLGYQAGADTGTLTVEFATAWTEWLHAHSLSVNSDMEHSVSRLLREYIQRVPASARRCSIPGMENSPVTASPQPTPPPAYSEPTDRHVTGTGYRNMRWGESMESVKRKTGGRYVPLNDGEDRIQFSDSVAGIQFTAAARLHNNQLYMVVLTGNARPGDPAIQKIVKALLHDFGPATAIDKGRESITLTWVLSNESLVMLTFDGSRYISGQDSQPTFQLLWMAPKEYVPQSMLQAKIEKF
jgi:hypothetical protein